MSTPSAPQPAPSADAPPSGRPFLLIQTRPEDEAARAEEEAVRRLGGFAEHQLAALRLDRALDADPDARQDWAALVAGHAGVILSGSPYTSSVPQETKDELQVAVELELGRMLDAILDADAPFLGCCYGVGTLGAHAGGTVDGTHAEPAGPTDVTLTEAGAADPLLEGLPPRFTAYVGHKEGLTVPPPGAVVLATGEACPTQMFRLGRRQYATQFHPELDQAGLVERLRIYLHHGYVDPEDAEDTFARIESTPAPVPPRILENFRRVFG